MKPIARVLTLLGTCGLASVAASAGGTRPTEEVAPQIIWFDGLERIQGTFKFVQVSSPGGLWLTEVRDGKERVIQISLNETPEPLREKLKRAEITFKITPGTSRASASQQPSPGPRGARPNPAGGLLGPYHGHLRFYEEHAEGELKMRDLPGIGGAQGDAGEYSGKAGFELLASNHSDPSDFGIFQERLAQEQIWGPAAQSRNFASFSASTGNEAAAPIANARLLRGGREIVSFIEWEDPAPPAGVTRRQVKGSVRLFRME